MSNTMASHWSKDKTSFGYNIPEDLKTDTLEDVQEQLASHGLSVSRGETQVIIPQQDAGLMPTGQIVRFHNGDVQVSSRNTRMRSRDGGMTWRQVESKFGAYACCLSNGDIVQLLGAETPDFPREKSETEGLLKTSASLLRSSNNGTTETVEPAAIYLPGKLTLSTLNHARIVELKDGSLLCATYGHFEADPIVTFETWVTKTGWVHPYTIKKNRVFVIRSTDGGRTWYYLSTVAFDLCKHTQTTIGGFNESDLLALPNGELLCFMRAVVGGGIRPLYMSMSNDGGGTWSNAFPVADRGVSPYACRMSNGTIVVVYGRPGNWLMFSVDEGNSFFGHFQFYMGPKMFDAWNYCALEEVAPDKLLVVYGCSEPSAVPGSDEAKKGEMAGTFFTVKRIYKAG